MHDFRPLMLLPLLIFAAGVACAAESAHPMLTVNSDGKSREYSSAALLGRADAVSVTVEDEAYRHSMVYRAVPLLALLHENEDNRSDTLEARGTDGFAAQIPLALIAREVDLDAVIAYLRAMSGKDAGAALPITPHSIR